MVRYLSGVKLILMVSLVTLLVVLLTSACNAFCDVEIFGSAFCPSPAPSGKILSPLGSEVLVGSPVEILSSYSAENVSRVELWVSQPGQADKLLRSDVPANGFALQEWAPQTADEYIIKVRVIGKENNLILELSKNIKVTASPAIALVPAGAGQPKNAELESVKPTLVPEVAVPTPTVILATPTAQQPGSAAAAGFAPPGQQVVVAEVAAIPSATPTPERRYPPPPPAPGVPPGSVKSDPDYGPPACDAAEYLGVYVPSTRQRVTIIEDDDVPAKVVAGTSVFRAWRLRNIGLCTWGPGYELAFYGGRAMGSGGVAFESTFPAAPPRRNIILDTNRLVVPEGKPNEVAVLEVVLNAPATPGIHQSYWRMRNPAGIYFGPILGVTLEVVRGCDFGIYGAPVINKFEIIGVGNVYRPENPVSVLAEVGQSVTLEYNIINATNFDIVFEDPTGNVQSVSTTDPSGRVTFPATRVGQHVITLYADNGVCTAQAQVLVEVIPPQDQQFNFDIILSSASACAASSAEKMSISDVVSAGNVSIQWDHFDKETNKFTLIGQAYQRVYAQQCPIVDSIFGWKGHCYMAWSDWKPVGSSEQVVVAQGTGAAAGTATIANLESKLLNSAGCSTTNPNQQCGIQYVMKAQIDGRPAKPEFSNTVDLSCSPASTTLPTEIQGAGGAAFNPK